jgi:diguanylate cyclase (GGDEF)-like protein
MFLSQFAQWLSNSFKLQKPNVSRGLPAPFQTRAQILSEAKFGTQSPKSVSLILILVVPCILQILTTLGVTGLMSLHNQREQEKEIAAQWRDQVTERVEEQLETQLNTPLLVNRLNRDAIQLNHLLLTDSVAVQSQLRQQMQQFTSLVVNGISTEQQGIFAERHFASPKISFTKAEQSGRLPHYTIAEVETGVRAEADEAKPDRLPARRLTAPTAQPPNQPIAQDWYKAAMATSQPKWIPLFARINGLPQLALVAVQSVQVQSVQSSQQTGILMSGMSLTELSVALHRSQLREADKIFIIERSGALLATSTSERPLWFKVGSDQPQRLLATASHENTIQQTAEQILKRYGQFQQIANPKQFSFNGGGERSYVQVTPYRQNGLDWLIVVTIPASAFAGYTNHNWWISLALCLMSLGVTVAMAGYLRRKIARPILELSAASQKLAQGELAQPLDASRVKEIAALATSFNQMSQEIHQSRQVLQEYSERLEQKVYQRTQSLEIEICKRTAIEQVLYKANQELERLAFIDGLTQVANRRHFDDCLEQEWWRLRRMQTPLSLLLCDIDFFKQYNDLYGHQAGDDCLRRVASVLQAAAKRPADLVARYGGEEFAVILPNTPVRGALQVAKEIQILVERLQIPHLGATDTRVVTLSIGITSVIPEPGNSPQLLIASADRALYRAKSEGRNCAMVSRLQPEDSQSQSCAKQFA